MEAHSRLKEFEDELKGTKVNKRTEMSVGILKAKIARMREKIELRSKKTSKHDGFAIRRSGDATAILIGFPSVGKSTLLNSLTNQESAVAAYAFTTLTCIPGLLEINDAKIQILDVPGIVTGAAAGTGRGKEVLAVIQNADLIIFVIDAFYPEHYRVLQKEVFDSHVRLNQRRPDVTITKTSQGGIDIGATVSLTRIDRQTIMAIMREFGLMNASIVIREDINPDQLIDIIENNKIYRPALTVINKVDLIDESQKRTLEGDLKPDLMISAEKKENIEELKKLIFLKLSFIRVYCKEYGKKADLSIPLIIRAPATLKSVCEKLHKDFVKKFRFAKVWGSSKFPGQRFTKLDIPVIDKDVVEIRVR